MQAYVRTRTLDECLEMVKHGLKARTAASAAQDGSFTIVKKRQANTVIRAEADTRAEAFSDVDVSFKGDAAVALGGANGVPAAEGADAAAEGGAEAAAPAEAAGSGEWDEEQEVALVKALKRVGKEAADRWDQVSALVPGKNKAQCFRRFKEMKEAHKAKKGAPASKKK